MTARPADRRRDRAAALLLTLALVLGAPAGCGDDPDPPGTTELLGATVGIVATGCALTPQLGSGVVLDEPGRVVTVAHTLRGATGVVVVDAAGREHAATVTVFDKDRDLAVLDAPTVGATPLELGDVVLGAGQLLVWRRDGGAQRRVVEVVKRLRITIEDIYVEETVERTGLELAGTVEVGDSGAAVVGTDGAVIGIVYAASRRRAEVGFATDSAEIRAALAARSGAPVPTGRCV